MRWFEGGLTKKFAAGTGAGLLMSSLAFLILFVSLYRAQIEQERADAAEKVTRLLQNSLENAMLKRDLDGLQAIVNRLGQEEGILDVRITNPKGEVRFASQSQELGKLLTPNQNLLDRPTTQLMDDARGRPRLRSINPVRNKPACKECHGPMSVNPINGILYVDFDAEPIRRQAKTTTLMLMGAGSLIVFINLAGGWWFMRRFVVRPVDQLSAVSLRLSQGDLDARANLKGEDELALLGNRFNGMAASLQDKIEELRDKEQFLQQLVDAIPDGIRIIDADYRIVLANAAYNKQLGLDESASPPELCYASAHARESPCAEALITCSIKEMEKSERPIRLVHRHQRTDGRKLDVEIYAAPMRIKEKGESKLLVVESIRDLEQEIKFTHEQKLSELGRLAAGVAHEIYNPLSSVRLALHAVEQANSSDGPDRDRISEYLSLVDQEVETCYQVTERLLKLSVPPPDQQELVHVDRVIDDTLKLLRWEAETQSVRMQLCADEAPLRILATDSDMRMVALNLAQNACHAMPDGGTLRVRCHRGERRVLIVFEDTGVGIGTADQLRIFEPFFSRRADGVRGTGLGLPITKSIVEKHGGTISVDSDTGQGSRITLTFPDADKGQDELRASRGLGNEAFPGPRETEG